MESSWHPSPAVCFGLDQGQCIAGFCALLEELAVTLESLACQRGHGGDRRQRLAWSDVDLLDLHEPIGMAGPDQPVPLSGDAALGPAALRPFTRRTSLQAKATSPFVKSVLVPDARSSSTLGGADV